MTRRPRAAAGSAWRELQSLWRQGGGGVRRLGEDAAMGSEGKRPVAVARPGELGASAALEAWLGDAGIDGPYDLRPLSGGNSNETMLAAGGRGAPGDAPPAAGDDRLLRPQRRPRGADSGARSPTPRCRCRGRAGSASRRASRRRRSFDGGGRGSLARRRRARASGPPIRAPRSGRSGRETAIALADLHSLDWREPRPRGLRPARRVPRPPGAALAQAARALPPPRAGRLRAGRRVAGGQPPGRRSSPAILHGDFHVDNCLFAVEERPRLAAIIDWEMSTIGDPLLDVGLFLGFWGTSAPQPLGMPWVQAISRVAGRALAGRAGRAL